MYKPNLKKKIHYFLLNRPTDNQTLKIKYTRTGRPRNLNIITTIWDKTTSKFTYLLTCLYFLVKDGNMMDVLVKIIRIQWALLWLITRILYILKSECLFKVHYLKRNRQCNQQLSFCLIITSCTHEFVRVGDILSGYSLFFNGAILIPCELWDKK